MEECKKFYVYIHCEPDTGEVVYIGKGCGGRAWDVTRCRSQSKDHQNWMQDLCSKGFTPDDWVEILDKGLTEKQALKKENQLIQNQLTKFNQQAGEKQHQAKMTNQEARWAFIEAVVNKVPIKRSQIF